MMLLRVAEWEKRLGWLEEGTGRDSLAGASWLGILKEILEGEELPVNYVLV